MAGDWTTSTFGYPHEDWNRAKAEMRTKLVEVATRRGVIAYSELAKVVTAIRNPLGDSGEWPYAFNYLLGQISYEEHSLGRPLLSAVAVYKDEKAPGPGFDELVQSIGIHGDPLQIWITELNRCHAFYGAAGRG